MRKEDVADGEQTQIGARVDAGVYRAFRQWVEDENGGRAYSNVGDALERAMLEYMTDDDLHETVEQIDDQTKRNEALLRKVLTQVDADTAQKEKGVTTETPADTSVPQGKNPGDRKLRELHVVRSLYQSDGAGKWHADTIKEAVREVAGVSTQQTVQSYLEAITDTRAFTPTRQGNTWRMDGDATRELLAEHGLEVAP